MRTNLDMLFNPGVDGPPFLHSPILMSIVFLSTCAIAAWLIWGSSVRPTYIFFIMVLVPHTLAIVLGYSAHLCKQLWNHVRH